MNPSLVDTLGAKKADIIVWATKLGFKDVRLFFENRFSEENVPLNLLVELNDHPQANPDNTVLLEAKLIEQLGVEVVVLLNSRITDPLYAEGVKSASIALDKSIEEIKIHIETLNWQKNTDVQLKPLKSTSRTLIRQLNLANRVISEMESPASSASISASSKSSSSFFSENNKNRKREAANTIMNANQLSPEKRQRLKEILEAQLSEELLKAIETLNDDSSNKPSAFPAEPPRVS